MRPDFEQVFGQVPNRFTQRLERTLHALPADVTYSVAAGRARRRALAVLIAAAVLLLAVGTLAAMEHWGVTDFFSRKGHSLPAGAEALVETVVPQSTQAVADGPVRFSVREAVADSEMLYVVVEARPMREGLLLLPMDAWPDDPASNAGLGFDGSFCDYAAAQGLDMLRVDASICRTDGSHINSSADYRLEDDGTAAMQISCQRVDAAETDFLLRTLTGEFLADNSGLDPESLREGELRFALAEGATPKAVRYAPEGAGAVEGAAAVVEELVLTKTALGVYAALTFRIDFDAPETAQAQAANGLWFEFLDAVGARLPDGLSGTGSVGPIGDGRYVQQTDLAAMALPDSITVRGYDCWDKTRFGACTLLRAAE